MKAYICKACLFLTTCFIFTSCSTSKDLREERKKWKFSRWEQYFKDRALCLCVLQGLNNKAIQDSIIKFDKSYYNPLGIAVFDHKIKQLLKNEVLQMQADSINTIGRYPEDIRSLLEGKRVMNHCIEFYRSKKLDSVAKAEKKEWKKITSIMDRIHDSIPTY